MEKVLTPGHKAAALLSIELRASQSLTEFVFVISAKQVLLAVMYTKLYPLYTHLVMFENSGQVSGQASLGIDYTHYFL